MEPEKLDYLTWTAKYAQVLWNVYRSAHGRQPTEDAWTALGEWEHGYWISMAEWLWTYGLHAISERVCNDAAYFTIPYV